MSTDNDEIQPGQEQTLDIPAQGIEIKAGFGLDIGGSMAKLVYATDEGSTIRFHFVSYPFNEVDAIIPILKEKLGGKLKEGATMYTCGVGVQHFSDTLTKELNIKIDNTSEMDCFVRAFYHLTKLAPLKDLFHPIPPAIKANTAKLIQQLQETLASFSKMGAEHDNWDILEDKNGDKEEAKDSSESEKPKEDKLEEKEEQRASQENAKEVADTEAALPAYEAAKYPVLLCMLGSGGALIKIEEDGTRMILEGLTRCGRTFVGLGKILTGCKNFREIIELAARGDMEKLHMLGKHVKSDKEGDVYANISDDLMMYSFGHAMYKPPESFSREDLAAAWLNYITSDIAQSSHLTAMTHDIQTLYFCGGFVGLSQLVRDQLSTWLDFRCTVNAKSIVYNYHFLRMGGYYGALGALLKTLGLDTKPGSKVTGGKDAESKEA